jgi:hypothetical protein
MRARGFSLVTVGAVLVAALGCGDVFLTKFEDVRDRRATGGTSGGGGAEPAASGGESESGGSPGSGGVSPAAPVPCNAPEDCPKPPECREAACVAERCTTKAGGQDLACGSDDHSFCDEGVCVDRCTDGDLNGKETDVDCGGPECAPCATPKRCATNGDCARGLCLLSAVKPLALRCSDECYADSIKNGGEGGVDCGAACSNRCALGFRCEKSDDCSSKQCVDGVCCGTACDGPCERCEAGSGACVTVPAGQTSSRCPDPTSTCTEKGACANCENEKFDEKLETDVDCGGGGCAPCGNGKVCARDSDCASCICEGSTCQPKRCNNRKKDGCESDVDCGGVCGPCGLSQTCDDKADCATASCADGKCVSP